MSTPSKPKPNSLISRLPLYVKPAFLLALLTYLPPFLWFMLSGQGFYQHGYHMLLVLLASGPATGATLNSPKLATFLLASLLLNFIILLLDTLGWRVNAGISLGSLVLFALSVAAYYVTWGTVLVLRWRAKRK